MISGEPVDLLGLADHVVSEFEVEAERRGMRLSLQGESCQVTCDLDEIGILIRNLVDNALRYGNEGGRVAVRCRHAVMLGQQKVLLEVADDGPGVPSDE